MSGEHEFQNLMTDEMRDALERMGDIGNCWQMIADLMCPTDPNGDLSVVNRDKMSCALSFLQEEFWIARDRLGEEMHKRLVCVPYEEINSN